MQSTALYRVEKNQKQQIADLLTRCFYQDPLYQELLPDEDKRQKILPVYFECYLDLVFDYCEFYADSSQLRGIISVFDSGAGLNWTAYRLSAAWTSLRFCIRAARLDPSLRTLLEFARNIRFLTSSWEEEVKASRMLHIDLFAVEPSCRGAGLGSRLIQQVLSYADHHRCVTSLETHNSRNVSLYEHYGFQTFRSFGQEGGLKEYCMVRQ